MSYSGTARDGVAMRQGCIWVVACWSCRAAGCAARQPAAPADVLPARLIVADRLVRDGCFDCFAAAYEQYNELQRYPAISGAAASGAAQAAILMAAREAELG